MKTFFTDLKQAFKSKRVWAATITALVYALHDEMGITIGQEQLDAGLALIMALIVGDSLRAVTDHKYKESDEA